MFAIVFFMALVQEIKPRALWMLGNHSTTELHTQTLVIVYLLTTYEIKEMERGGSNVNQLLYFFEPQFLHL
jgi:hypothetical protein